MNSFIFLYVTYLCVFFFCADGWLRCCLKSPNLWYQSSVTYHQNKTLALDANAAINNAKAAAGVKKDVTSTDDVNYAVNDYMGDAEAMEVDSLHGNV